MNELEKIIENEKPFLPIQNIRTVDRHPLWIALYMNKNERSKFLYEQTNIKKTFHNNSLK